MALLAKILIGIHIGAALLFAILFIIFDISSMDMD